VSSTATIGSPSDRLIERIERCGSPVCVGLDPVLERLPAALLGDGSATSSVNRVRAVAAIERFSLGILDAVEGVVPAVKPQSACFERYGPEGFAALGRVIDAARGRFEIVLDWKRGDIGVSSEHYAAGAKSLGADWVTASAYLGVDGFGPFLDAGLGVFALVRTSNADGDRVQSLPLRDGGTVAEAVAALVAREGARFQGSSGFSALGAVVGATKGDDATSLRSIMPDQIFLVPGYGAQGAGPAEAAACFRSDGRGAIITASRSVIYAFDVADPRWHDAVRDAAKRFACEIAGVVPR